MPNSFDIGNQLESFIAELVKSGRYNSKSEASRGPAAAGARLASLPLDAAATRGIADVDAGRVKPLSQVFDRLEAKYCAVSSSPD